MKFYVINNHLFEDTEFAYGEEFNDDFNTGDAERCDKCGAALTSLKWLPPYEVKLSNPVFGDFVFGTIEPFLVSEHFKNEYEKSNLKGIQNFAPVTIKEVNNNRTKEQPPNYFLVNIRLSETLIDEEKSNLKREGKTQCPECRMGGIIKGFKGLYLLESSWNGEDIFYAKGLPGTIFVSERFKNFVEDRNISNIELIEAEKATPQF